MVPAHRSQKLAEGETEATSNSVSLQRVPNAWRSQDKRHQLPLLDLCCPSLSPQSPHPRIGEMPSLAPPAEQGWGGGLCRVGDNSRMGSRTVGTLPQERRQDLGRELRRSDLSSPSDWLVTSGSPLTGPQFPCLQIGRLSRHPGR